MPKMDGYDERARSQREQTPSNLSTGNLWSHIAVTANAGRAIREKCFAAGMDDISASQSGWELTPC